MTRSYIGGTLLLSLLFFACGNEAADTSGEFSEEPVYNRTTAENFGAAFDYEENIPASNLLMTYSEEELQDTVATTLIGTVNEVCQAKGCWMTIAAGQDAEMMVKFKDYGFFVPKDISGREIAMSGIAYYEVTPVDELRHYAQDAGQSADEIAAITAPKRELKFLADGVVLLD